MTVTLHTSSNELQNCNTMVLPRTEKISFKLLSAFAGRILHAEHRCIPRVIY